MRYFLKFSMVCYLLLFVGCDNSGPDYISAPSPVVTLSVSAESIILDENISLDISVENLSDIFGISFEISYDPTYLELVANSGLNDYSGSVTDNDFFGPVTYSNTIEGIFSFAMSGENIEGKIYTASFTGKSIGQASITLGNVHLVQSDGSPISNYNSFSLPDPITIIVSENE